MGLTLYTLGKAWFPKGPWTVWTALLFILLAGLPDLDVFIPYWGSDFSRVFHRTYSHSLWFGLFFGWALAWLLSLIRSLRWRGWSFWLPLVILSHSLMDMICVDHVKPYGIEWFWPFSYRALYYPLPFVASVGTYHGKGMDFMPAFWITCLQDAVVFGLLYVIIRGLTHRARY